MYHFNRKYLVTILAKYMSLNYDCNRSVIVSFFAQQHSELAELQTLQNSKKICIKITTIILSLLIQTMYMHV